MSILLRFAWRLAWVWVPAAMLAWCGGPLGLAGPVYMAISVVVATAIDNWPGRVPLADQLTDQLRSAFQNGSEP